MLTSSESDLRLVVPPMPGFTSVDKTKPPLNPPPVTSATTDDGVPLNRDDPSLIFPTIDTIVQFGFNVDCFDEHQTQLSTTLDNNEQTEETGAVEASAKKLLAIRESLRAGTDETILTISAAKIAPPENIPRVAINAELAETADVSLAVSSTVGSLAAASGPAAAQAARSRALMQAEVCHLNYGPLPFLSHPLGFPLGGDSEEVKYFAGAMVGNLIVMVGLIAIHGLLVVLFYSATKNSTSRSIRKRTFLQVGSKVKFPCFTWIIVMLLAQDTVWSTVLVVSRANDLVLRIIASILAALWLFGGVGGVLRLTYFRGGGDGNMASDVGQLSTKLSESSSGDDSSSERSDFNANRKKNSRRSRRIPPVFPALTLRVVNRGKFGKFFLGPVEWEDLEQDDEMTSKRNYKGKKKEKNPRGANHSGSDDEDDVDDTKAREKQLLYNYVPGFVGAFDLMFSCYQFHRRWFMAVELGMIYFTGVAMAIRPDGGACEVFNIPLLAIFALYFLVLILARPYKAAFEQYICFLMAALQVASAGMLFYSDGEKIPGYLALAAMVLATIKALFDIVILCLDCAGAFGSHETVDPKTGKRRRSKDEQSDHSGKGKREQSLEESLLNPLQGRDGGDTMTLLHTPPATASPFNANGASAAGKRALTHDSSVGRSDTSSSGHRFTSDGAPPPSYNPLGKYYHSEGAGHIQLDDPTAVAAVDRDEDGWSASITSYGLAKLRREEEKRQRLHAEEVMRSGVRSDGSLISSPKLAGQVGRTKNSRKIEKGRKGVMWEPDDPTAQMPNLFAKGRIERHVL